METFYFMASPFTILLYIKIINLTVFCFHTLHVIKIIKYHLNPVVNSVNYKVSRLSHCCWCRCEMKDREGCV